MELSKIKLLPTGSGKRVIMEYQDGDKKYDIRINPDDLSSPDLNSDSFNVYNKQGRISGKFSFLSDRDVFQGTFDKTEFKFSKDQVINYIPDKTVNEFTKAIISFYYRKRDKFGGYEAVAWNGALNKIADSYHAEIQKNKVQYGTDLLADYQIPALWHFCHIDNVSSILQYGLISRKIMKEKKLLRITIIPYFKIDNIDPESNSA